MRFCAANTILKSDSSLPSSGGDDDSSHGHNFCKAIATKVHSEKEFPVECKQYNDAVSLFKRHTTAAKNIYAGMSPADAIDAMRARDEGHLNGAQIKRRMTGTKNGRFY